MLKAQTTLRRNGPANRQTNGFRVTDSMSSVNEAIVNSAWPAGHTDADKHANKKLTKKEKEREGDEMDDVRTELATAVEIDDHGISLSTAVAKPLPRSLATSPAPSASTNRRSQIDLASPTESSGTRTPVNNGLKRNPWTLFVNQLPVPVSEDEIKAFFGSAASKVR
jgi:hypothetical protein